MEEDSGDDKDDTKRKSRNLSEKKRRDQFNALVNDLSALISTSNRKMDKSTVLKSTIAFLKHHNEATDRSKVFEIQQDWKPTFLTNDEFTHLMLESLDGFIIVFSSSGFIFYASESITSLLGYLPADLLNMSIYDITYELDHECLFNIFLNPKPVIEPLQTDITSSNQISFYIHLKRGGIEKVDANAYELVKFVGYFRNDVNIDSLGLSMNSHPTPRVFQMNPNVKPDRKLIFVGTGRIQTPQLIREMSAIDPTRNEFTSKHSMEWKFLFLDHRAPPIIGYMPFEVLGTSGYDYYHFDDLDSIIACHEELMQKGEGKSCYYRFLTKGQQWIWLQTDFYISYHQFNAKPDYVVCTHKVVSYADVIRQSKGGSSRDSQILKCNEDSSKSATVPLGDFDVAESINAQPLNDTSSQLSTGTPSLCNVNNTGSALNDPTGTLDIGNMWGSGSSAVTQPQMTPQLRSSRPGSSYGNISSTGISPTVKRKRYLNNRGYESDSTSMSADSGTSKQSLMTHISSASGYMQNRTRHGGTTNSHHQNQYLPQHHHQHTANMLPQLSHQPAQLATFHHPHSHGHPNMHPHHGAIGQVQTGQKIIPVLPQHPIAPGQVVGNNSCQYTQPTFSTLRGQQIVAPTFLEPPQYLTAIPVQPVIAPFPVAPVISPITSQADIIPSALVMTPTQAQLQEQLQRKHDELQKLIMQQQDELRIVSEQLLLARYTLLQPVVPMAAYSGTTASVTPTNVAVSQTGRNFNFGSANGPVESQFNPYGFTMRPDPISSQQNQQNLVQQQQQQQQQQQNLQQQQQQNLTNTQQHLGHSTIQQHNQNQQSTVSSSQSHTQQNQAQQQQHQPTQSTQQNPTNFLSRNVPDLDQFGQEDIDAFLNLSPLQSMGGSQNALNQLPANGSNASNNIGGTNNVNTPLNQSYVNNSNAATVSAPNDDSLLSYMQMAAEASPTLNFRMGISDDGSTQSEDTKHLPTDQQQQTSSFFGPNPFQSSGSNAPANHLPNDLEILPYQMSQEQSQNLFNSPTNK